MPKIAILNMLIGFSAIFIAASAGSFIALETTDAFTKDPNLLHTWYLLTAKSAHGHTSMFGLLHIAFGLTIPYSSLSNGFKKIQTSGLFMGTIAMSIMMVIKSLTQPQTDISVLEVSLGVFLSAALIALGTHCYGLYTKMNQ
jgi:uncharacterized membrane protein